MVEQLKVVIASNRGPVSFLSDNGGFDIKRGAGGLAGALDPVARRLGVNASWIAAATSQTDRDALGAGKLKALPEILGYEFRLLDIDPETYSFYYDDISNGMLWFANHCLWEEIDRGPADDPAAWAAYERVNERFAQAIAEVSDAHWFVMFQDYHLATAPGFLREMRADQLMFHFTHSSFCREGLRRLSDPIPHRIVQGMLACDLIGFHTHRWATEFMECCRDVGASVDLDRGRIEHDGRTTWVRNYPIPIDAAGLAARAEKKAAREWATRFTAAGDKTLLVRADRTEPSKNIVRGFEAFGALLDRRADLATSAVFIACLYPSRQSMPEYKEYIDRITSTVADVNARHPGAIDLYLEDDFDRTLGALKVYDALLVNSIMDGMNLVSKEGPALNERDGVVILSSGAGSFDELGPHTIPIDDPTDLKETELAIERALDMPRDDRVNMSSYLKVAAAAMQPEDWIEGQLRDLQALRDTGRPATPY
jgi:trehalose 6-phosphate synthase